MRYLELNHSSLLLICEQEKFANYISIDHHILHTQTTVINKHEQFLGNFVYRKGAIGIAFPFSHSCQLQRYMPQKQKRFFLLMYSHDTNMRQGNI